MITRKLVIQIRRFKNEKNQALKLVFFSFIFIFIRNVRNIRTFILILLIFLTQIAQTFAQIPYFSIFALHIGFRPLSVLILNALKLQNKEVS